MNQQQWQNWATHQPSFSGGVWPPYDQRYSNQGSYPLQPFYFGNQLTYISQYQPQNQYSHQMSAQLLEHQRSSSMNQDAHLSVLRPSAIDSSCFPNFQQSQLPTEPQPLYGSPMLPLSKLSPVQIQAQHLPPKALHHLPEQNIQIQPSAQNQPSSREHQFQTIPSQPLSRQYDKPVLPDKQPKEPKAAFPNFEMQFPIFQKAGDAGGEMEKKIINRSHRLITEEDFENREYITFCKYNSLHVLDYLEIENHEEKCIDRELFNQLKQL